VSKNENEDFEHLLLDLLLLHLHLLHDLLLCWLQVLLLLLPEPEFFCLLCTSTRAFQLRNMRGSVSRRRWALIMG
jgi:hypothetical protein